MAPSAILNYGYLQLLDLLTTIAFLLNGIPEGNPLVRLALQAAPNPIGGLIAIKVLALGLGLYCWRSSKIPLLHRVNIFFALLVAWNLVALILGSAFPSRLS